MATHSSILAWRIPRTEEPGPSVHRSRKSWTRLKQPGTHAKYTETNLTVKTFYSIMQSALKHC